MPVQSVKSAFQVPVSSQQAMGGPVSKIEKKSCDTFTALGTQFTKLTPVETPVHKRFGDKFLDVVYRLYDKTKFSSFLDKLAKKHDPDALIEVQKAQATPLVKQANGSTAALGDVTVVVNGLLNLNTTPATLFRMAEYTNGPLIVASSNTNGKEAFHLRPLEEIWGEKVPAHLKNKIFIIGEFAPNIVPWTDATDILLKQLDVVNQQFGSLNNSGVKAKSLEEAKVTLMGYSQGALTALAARRALNENGKGAFIDSLI
jgi:hypothetical protein